MNQAPIPTRASCTATGGRWLARALQVGAAACMATALVCAPALAQRQGDHGDRDPRGGQDQRVQQVQQDPRAMDQRAMQQRAPEQAQPRFDPRSFDSREFSDRRQDPAARGQDQHHPSRMTPDERRDLRRQINEAGMDLYTRPPRR